MRTVHFISSVTRKGVGGGTILWKSLINELKTQFSIAIHYSYDAENIWGDFLSSEIKHFMHKNWNTYENRKFNKYDLSFVNFNFKHIKSNDLVIFDSLESIVQLFPIIKIKKVKSLWHCQSLYRLHRYNFIYNLFDKYLISHLNKIITISYFLKESFPIKNIPIDVIYNGVSQANNPKKIQAKNKNIVAFFGRYERSKNPLFLEEITHDHIYIGNSDSATFKVNVPKEKDIGWKTPEQAAELADIFIFPYMNEGFGLALVEMMALGKICIAFNNGPFPEIIQHEENGFLVDPFDSKAVDNIIVKIKNDDILRNKISENAFNSVEKYSIKIFSNNFYKALISL